MSTTAPTAIYVCINRSCANRLVEFTAVAPSVFRTATGGSVVCPHCAKVVVMRRMSTQAHDDRALQRDPALPWFVCVGCGASASEPGACQASDHDDIVAQRRARNARDPRVKTPQ